MFNSLSQVVTATLAAEAGGAIGIAIDTRSHARLHNLVWVAAGAMLAVTCFDMLPESYRALGLFPVLAITLLGMGLIAFMAKFLPSVCPACDIGTVDGDASPIVRNVWMIAVALSVHCALDGVGFVGAERLNSHHDLGLVIGLSLHKLPEGLALSLLLLNAGFKREAAFLWTLACESFTLVGAGIVLVFGPRFNPAWIAAAVAFVGGGFLYLIVETLLAGANSHRGSAPRGMLRAAGLGLLATSLIILLTR